MSTTIFKMPDDTEIPLVVDPADQTIADEGGYFESDNVEDALQEIGEALNDIPDTPEIEVPEEVTVGATPAEGAKIFIDTAAHFGDYLYNEGNEYTDITGGWELLSVNSDNISFSKETSYISFVRTGAASPTSKIRIVTNKKIDITNIDKLKFYASTTNANRSAIDIYITLAKSDTTMINLVHSTDFPTPIIADTSAYTGEYYVIFEFSVWMSSVNGQLTLVELEFNADTPAETLKYLFNGTYKSLSLVRPSDLANIPVTDAGGYFEATTVEGVLQEIGSKLAELLTPSS